jgi:hypothetical protein
MIAMTRQHKTGPTRRGRARDRGTTVPVTVELDTALDAALEAVRLKDRRTKRAVITIAIEEYLTRNGAWPPAPEKGGGR